MPECGELICPLQLLIRPKQDIDADKQERLKYPACPVANASPDLVCETLTKETNVSSIFSCLKIAHKHSSTSPKMPVPQDLLHNDLDKSELAKGTLTNTVIVIPTLFLGLFVASLWSIDHYWRNLTVSWIATASVTYFTAANYHDTTLMQSVWLFALASTLLLWSILLTPIQLLIRSAEERTPTAQVEVILDPLKCGLRSDAIIAEYVITVNSLYE